MNEFEAFMVESIVRDLFDKFQRDEEERLRREKEERDNAEAKRFRVYNLSLKYFYRWKKNAREKRLRQLRRSGREQFRAFREAQRAAQIREEQETAQRIATQKAELAALNRPDELAAVIRNNQRNKRKAESEKSQCLVESINGRERGENRSRGKRRRVKSGTDVVKE